MARGAHLEQPRFRDDRLHRLDGPLAEWHAHMSPLRRARPAFSEFRAITDYRR